MDKASISVFFFFFAAENRTSSSGILGQNFSSLINRFRNIVCAGRWKKW